MWINLIICTHKHTHTEKYKHVFKPFQVTEKEQGSWKSKVCSVSQHIKFEFWTHVVRLRMKERFCLRNWKERENLRWKITSIKFLKLSFSLELEKCPNSFSSLAFLRYTLFSKSFGSSEDEIAFKLQTCCCPKGLCLDSLKQLKWENLWINLLALQGSQRRDISELQFMVLVAFWKQMIVNNQHFFFLNNQTDFQDSLALVIRSG